ncbi:Bax inhibitor-1/YccA family protein [Carnobacteriaceae bacterium zg-ZUI252]|nr:Bax inhibitor-1/YccA family protein [Carnobacteriaceae bacterium zg-ZUI252]MBS4770273.1 Bax inhibitor-1/YccA family protein [Carnobacteriaceae bacterium zg-ZUI240]QTU82438.1 Bax inhibitor-1/YccA family protein [Carnobacteriaceae bacterium zg-C25]
MSQNTIYSAEQQNLNRFISKTFMWMIAGLLISAVSAFFVINNPVILRFVYGSRFGVFALMIVQMILAYTLRPNPEKMENSSAYIAKFTAYSFLTGITFAVIALVYTTTSIVQAFVTTAALFAILAIYGYTTKRDLTKLGNILLPALLGLIVLSVINMFIGSTGMSFVLTVVTVVIFVGLTMYDMQKIKVYYLYFEHATHLHASLAISCALELYLDFINLFLSVLRLFGTRRD